MCKKCKEINNCENKKNHIFKDYKEKNEEISKKEKFILCVLDEKDKYNKTTKSKNTHISNILYI